jgi:hypothetical protein
VSPVTFAILTDHLIMLSGLAMFYVFRKKWGFVRSFVCWSVLIQSHYGGVVIVGWESDLCANDMTWFKCVFRLILSNDLLIYQWNPIFMFSVNLQIREKHFFSKINAYLNILNQ